MDELGKIVLPLVASSILGVIAAVITTNYRFKKQLQSERDKQKEHIRLKILNPLLVSSEDFLGRIIDIKRRRKDPSKCNEMVCWFKQVKTNPWSDKRAFGFWANDEGYFAMSTLYITTLYFYYASKIRRDFPFVELSSGGETALLSHISEVRTSIGGKYGIWEAMQDSLGTYLEDNTDKLKNYRQFCEAIIDDRENIWFNRLIDFYRDVHLKLDDQFDNIEHSLKALITFLNGNLQIKRIEYHITEASIKNLNKRKIPDRVINQLRQLIGQSYKNEVDFVDRLVECIGQDLADDYKPSILKCAERKMVQPATS